MLILPLDMKCKGNIYIVSANPRPDALMKEQLVEMTGLRLVDTIHIQNKTVLPPS